MSGFLRSPVGGWGRWKRERPASFWIWFQSHAAWRLRLEEDDPQQADILDDLQRHLDAVSRGLTFEIGGGPEGEDLWFAISADGRPELFRAVRELVEGAPRIPGLRILAFRQRKDVLYDVHLGDIHLAPARTWFRAEPAGDRLRLTLFIEGLTPETRPGLEGAARLVLEDALGEQDAHLRIASLAVRPAPEDPEREGLRPLRDLASAVVLD
jgi:hypothetical protein